MRRRFSHLYICLLLLAPVLFSATPLPYHLNIVESSEQAIVCDVVFDSVQVTQKRVQGVWQSVVTMTNSSYTAKQSWPVLPVTSLVLGIPDTGTPRVQVEQEQTLNKQVHDIATVSHPEAWLPYLGPEEVSNTSFQEVDGWYPAESVRSGLCGMMRNQRILQIELHPVRYAVTRSMLAITKSLRLRVVFDRAAVATVQSRIASTTENTEVEKFYSEYLANYSQARNWRAQPALPLAKTGEQLSAAQNVRIDVLHDGVYAVTGKELRDAGIELQGVDPSTLSMSNRGRDIPILVEDRGDGSFDETDRILFIGEHNSSATTYYSWFSDTNVYFLTLGGKTGSRMAQVSGALGSAVGDTIKAASMRVHLEQDLQYERQLAFMQEDADHWFWRELKDKEQYTIPFSIPTPAADASFRLRVEMQGVTYLPATPDHKVTVSLNAQELGTVTWDNQEVKVFDSSRQNGGLLQKENNVTLYLPGDLPNVTYDRVLLNYLDLECTAALQAVDDSLRFQLGKQVRRPILAGNFSEDRIYIFSEDGQQIIPDRIRAHNGTYEVLFASESGTSRSFYMLSEKKLAKVNSIVLDSPSDLTNQSNGADYIIIAHSKFMEQARTLAQFRAAQGFRTMVVDVQDIYDTFNAGVFDPAAIHAFLQYAYRYYKKPAPLYVLLFGDTTHYMDKLQAHRLKYVSYVPTLMSYTTSWGMTSSDNGFVTVSGDDILPDMYIGRFPVNTVEEADILVHKTMEYESQPVISDWRRNVIMVTGNAQQFETDADELFEEYMPRRVVTNRLATLTSSIHFGSTEDLAQAWNSGQVVINFVGHGGGQVFEDSRLFLLEDVSRLKNKDKYSVMFSLTCFIGYFDNPEKASLSEELLRRDDLGIVAHFGSAGRASMLGDHYLDKALFRAIFKEGRRRIGEITTQAKYDLIEMTNGYWDTIRHFNLLGDPAARMALAEDNLSVKLTKPDLVSGDVIQATVQQNGFSDGQVLLSVHNDKDSLLVQKTAVLQQGKAVVDLMTLTPALVKAWANQTGSGSVKVYASNGQKDGAGAAEFTVNRYAQAAVSVDPSNPLHNQPFYFSAMVDNKAIDQIGGVTRSEIQWSVNQASWNVLPVLQDLGGVWKTATPLSASEGTRIFYRLVLTGTVGKEIRTPVAELIVRSRADLFVDAASVRVDGVNQAQLSAKLRNNGATDAVDFTITAYVGADAATYSPIGEKIFVSRLAAQRDTTLTLIWPGLISGSYKVWLRTDVENKVDENNESNNTTTTTIRVANPAQGSGGPVFSNEANVSVNIPVAAMPKINVFTINRTWDTAMQEACTQNSLTPLRVRDMPGAFAFSVSFADSSLTLKKESTVSIFYDRTNVNNQTFLTNGGMRLYTWNQSTSTWAALSYTVDTYQGCVTAKLPVFSTYFSLLGSADKTGPTLQVGVVGQNFASGDVVAKQPTFTIFAEDSTGFDVTAKPAAIKLNGQLVADDQIRISQNPDVRRSLSITWSPELLVGDHMLQIEVKDINGNVTVQQVQCRVVGQFELDFVANHPNPFMTSTTIALQLQDTATEVDLNIYTVSGRLIRNQKLFGVTGYVEWDWDGKDEEGDAIANGVYYLKVTARNGDKKIERIEKMAKLE
jgi:hypothetical protein